MDLKLWDQDRGNEKETGVQPRERGEEYQGDSWPSLSHYKTSWKRRDLGQVLIEGEGLARSAHYMGSHPESSVQFGKGLGPK